MQTCKATTVQERETPVGTANSRFAEGEGSMQRQLHRQKQQGRKEHGMWGLGRTTQTAVCRKEELPKWETAE